MADGISKNLSYVLYFILIISMAIAGWCLGKHLIDQEVGGAVIGLIIGAGVSWGFWKYGTPADSSSVTDDVSY